MTNWREEDGYITVAVVGVTALMATLVAALLMLSRPTAILARLDVEQLRQQSLVDAGLNMAAFLLFFEGKPPSFVNGRQLAIGGGMVSLDVSPETGRVDLNTSSPDLLRRLFTAARGTSMSPDAFAARVADWRDEDDERTIEGAEAFEYAAAPDGVQPANAPFRSVDDLRFLLGLSPEDRAKLEPFLTTFNREGQVDPKEAVGLVRIALVGERLDDASTLDAASSLSGAAPADAPPDAAGGPAEKERQAFRVRVFARTAVGRPVYGTEAIIAPPLGEHETYSVLEWHGLSAPFPGRERRAGVP